MQFLVVEWQKKNMGGREKLDNMGGDSRILDKLSFYFTDNAALFY